jgi:hypothetical protein
MKTSLIAAAAGGTLIIAAGLAAPAMAQDTTVSGRVYYDVTNIDQTSNGSKTALASPNPNGTAFDIKRFYIGIDHKFNDTYSANLTTDFQYNATLGSTELFIKKAYLQGKYSDAFTVRLGSADMPWIPYVEDLYGYRYLEKTITDGFGQATSADWGVHVLGKLGDIVSYQVSAVNGEGYKTAPGTGSAPRTNAIDFEGRISAQYEGFNLAIGGYDGKLGKDVVGGAAVHNTATRVDALAAYVKGPIRVGVEYFKSNNYNVTLDGSSVSYITSTFEGSGSGVSTFASYKFSDTLGVFARYDHGKFVDNNPALVVAGPPAFTLQRPEQDYYTVGATYSPYKNVDFSLAYKDTRVKDGSIGGADTTVGAPNGVNGEGKRQEVGLWGQFRW